MLIYLIISLFILFLVVAWGILFHSVFFEEYLKTDAVSLPVLFLSGVAILSIITGYISIFAPVNHFTAITLCLIEIVGLILSRNRWLIFLSALKRMCRTDFFLFLFIFLFISFFAATGIANTDTGLYHLQAVKWINEFAVVPGLGNIHGRFAFNSMFFPVSAASSVNAEYLGKELVVFPLNALVLIVFLSWQSVRIRNYVNTKNFKSIVYSISLNALVLIYLLKWGSSLSPDLFCSILAITLLELLFFNNLEIRQQQIISTLLVFTSISFKLSTIPLALIIPLFLIRKEFMLRDFGVLATLGLVVFLPFLIRNYYLSGYLIYPFPSLDVFQPDWKIPIQEVIDMKDVIEAFAKEPFYTVDTAQVLSLSFPDWFIPWYLGKDILLKGILLLAFIFPILGFILKRSSYNPANHFKLVFIISANLLFWIKTAPDPRFTYGFLFFTVSYSLYFVFDLLQEKLKATQVSALVVSITLLFTAPLFVIYPKMVKTYAQNTRQIVFPTTFSPKFDFPTFEKQKGNFDYYVPSFGGSCFNQEIPCATHYLNSNIVLRGQSLAEGFKVISFKTKN